MDQMQEQEQESFRDRLSTIGEEGNRVWVYPKKPKGKFYTWRSYLSVVLLVFFFGAPFIKLNGDPLILLNIIERKFVIFGVIFWPQDFHLLVLSMITLIVFIVLFTVIYGRLFCGWVCPQTIFMEFVYRQVEYLIEGNHSQQRKLDKERWTLNKVTRKTVKHFLFLVISLVTIATFAAYVVGFDKVKVIVSEGPAQNPATFAGLFALSLIHYFVFAKFREQVCIIVCPYGRLQGVLLDKNSINVTYDYKRGEPRGKHNPLENRSDAKKGDCIDCNSCTLVCPTGIDIRNGTQLECINCTACIDACDAVMNRMNWRTGLIRYASEHSIAEGTRLKFNARIVFYSAILTGLLVVVGYLFNMRTDVETTVLRVQGTLYQQYDANHHSNIYIVQVVNKTRKDFPVEISTDIPSASILLLGDPLFATRGKLSEVRFLLILPDSVLQSSKTPVTFKISSEGREIESIRSTFLGPNK